MGAGSGGGARFCCGLADPVDDELGAIGPDGVSAVGPEGVSEVGSEGAGAGAGFGAGCDGIGLTSPWLSAGD